MRVNAEKKAVFGLLGIVLLAVCVFVGVRIVSVNAHAVTVPVEHYSMNEWVSLDGTFFQSAESEYKEGYSIKIDSAKRVSLNEFIAEHCLDRVTPEMDFAEESIIDLEVSIKNEGNEHGAIELLPMILVPERKNEYYIWNADVWEMSEPTSKDLLAFAVKVDTEYTTHIPFTRNNVSGDTTSLTIPILDNSFELTLSNGPVKKVVDISV